MKNKRFLSLMLAIVLTVSLFAGLTTTAYADDSVITYTVKQNDYLWKICNSLGLDYYTCKDAIILLNGFSTETQLNRLYVGQQIKLPASNAIAQTVTKTTTTTVNVGSTVVNTNSSTTSASTDSVVYYLVNYTVKSGDTLYSICNSLGTSYAKYSDMILTINGITSVTHIWAGKTVFIPVDTKPSTGTYYSVVKHKVSSGETLTSICNNYGINYSSNTKLVQGLNDGYNLNSIKVGQTVLVPSTKTITPVTPTATATATATPVSGSYKINFNSGAHGSPYATINGTRATSSNSGSTVYINTVPDSGYVVDTIQVTKKSGASVTVTDNSFTMPDSDVTITVKYTTGDFSIQQNTPANGSYTVLVNGQECSAANTGDKITLKMSPNETYKVDTVYYTNASNGNTVTVNPDSNGNYIFYMPKHNIKITVKFAGASYVIPSLTVSDGDGKGTLVVEKDGVAVTKNRMYEGNTYIVKISPNSGCELDSERKVEITANNMEINTTKIADGTYQIYVSKINTGKTLVVSAKIDKSSKHSLTYSSTSNVGGSVAFKVGSTFKTASTATTAKSGDTVYIMPKAPSGYKFVSSDSNISVRYASGASKITPILDPDGSGYYCFTMVEADVNVNITYTASSETGYTISGTGFRTYDASGNERNKFDAMTWVRIDPTDFIPAGKAIDKVYIGIENVVYAQEIGISHPDGTNVSGYWVAMPAATLFVNVTYKDSSSSSTDTFATVKTNSIPVGYSEIIVNGVTVVDGTNVTKADIKVGSKIQIAGFPNSGYKIDAVTMTINSTSTKIEPDANGNYYYTIKSDEANQTLSFEVTFTDDETQIVKYAIKNSNPNNGKCIISVTKDDGKTWNEYENGQDGYAEEGNRICITALFDSSKYKIGTVKVDGNVVSTTEVTAGTEKYYFDMPGHDVEVIVTFSPLSV